MMQNDRQIKDLCSLSVLLCACPEAFGLVIRVQLVMCELDARQGFEPCSRQKSGIWVEKVEGGTIIIIHQVLNGTTRALSKFLG